MTCPKCGSSTLADQRFCRSCGETLQKITKPLPESQVEPTSAIRRETRPANAVTFWGFVIMFIGAAIGVIGKKLMHQDLVTVIGVLLSLMGMFLVVYPYLVPRPRRKDYSNSNSSTIVLTPSQPARSLPQESDTEYIPSVTERTTDLLEISAAAPKRQPEDELKI